MRGIAVQQSLVPYDSTIDTEIRKLKEAIRDITQSITDLSNEFDDLIAHYRLKSPDLCALMSDLMAKLEDNATRPPPPVKKKEKQRIKEQYRRVSALSHPDKTHGFHEVVREQLKTIFICAKQAYDRQDLATLIQLTDEAARIRSTRIVQDAINGFDADEIRSMLDDEVKRQQEYSFQEDKEQTLAILKMDYATKLSQYEDLKHTTMWQVKKAHDAGDLQKAFEMHRMLFMENIGILGDKLQAQINREYAAKREKDFWSRHG